MFFVGNQAVPHALFAHVLTSGVSVLFVSVELSLFTAVGQHAGKRPFDLNPSRWCKASDWMPEGYG